TWTKRGVALTKIESQIPVDAARDRWGSEPDSPARDQYEQEIHILPANERQSRPIVTLRHSLMSILADHGLYSLRVYALLPPSHADRGEEIRRWLEQDWHGAQGV